MTGPAADPMRAVPNDVMPSRIITWERVTPKAGYYGVVQTPGWFPWVIQKATRSWADHAFMLVDDHGTLVEAMPGGVRYGHLSQYEGCRAAFNLGERMTDAQRMQVVAAAEAMVGTPYNDIGIVDDGLAALGWHWRLLARLANGDHELDCSQAVALMGKAARLNWSCGRQVLCEVTPGDLQRRPGMREL